MDYEDMEAKIRKYHIHAAIMCSPHNPTGRVWEQWELEKAMAVYEQYDVTVISDEIWSDILLDGQKHIPTQQIVVMPGNTQWLYMHQAKHLILQV